MLTIAILVIIAIYCIYNKLMLFDLSNNYIDTDTDYIENSYIRTNKNKIKSKYNLFFIMVCGGVLFILIFLCGKIFNNNTNYTTTKYTDPSYYPYYYPYVIYPSDNNYNNYNNSDISMDNNLFISEINTN
jgi:hypothetical protein